MPRPKKPEVLIGKGGPTEQGWHRISSFLECPQKYLYSQVRKIRRPLSGTPDYFAVGLLFHAGRARWFTLRFDTSAQAWSSIQDAMAHEAEEQKLPIRAEAERQALRYMQEYVNHWSVRPKPRPVAAEYLIGPAPLSKDPGDISLTRTARLDDVSYYPGDDGLYIGEAKTDGESVDNCVETYTLHGQPLMQRILWGMAPQGEAKLGPVKGVMLDMLIKGRGKNKSKFARMPIPITQKVIDWYIKSMRGYLRAAASVNWNSEVPHNPTMCKRCDFRDLCMHGRSAAGQFVLENGDSLVRWKPTEGKEKEPWT